MNVDMKEIIYSLQNVDNFKKELHRTPVEILYTLSTLLIEYVKFIYENTKIKNKIYVNFVIFRGLNTIIHVFRHLLYYTKNLDLTYFHCQKSFYYYVEFVGQIMEEDKTFLQLTTRDATIYVYKKTIYDINNEWIKKNKHTFHESNDTFKIIDIYINIATVLFCKMIDQCYTNVEKEKKEKKEQPEQLKQEQLKQEQIQTIKMIIQDPNFISLDEETMKKMEKIIYTMNHIFQDTDEFFELNIILFKNIVKSKNVIHKLYEKINSMSLCDCDNNISYIKESIFSCIS